MKEEDSLTSEDGWETNLMKPSCPLQDRPCPCQENGIEAILSSRLIHSPEKVRRVKPGVRETMPICRVIIVCGVKPNGQ